MKKRMLALFLALTMLAALFGCTATQSGDPSAKGGDEKTAALNAKYAYKAETIALKLPEGVDSVYNLTKIGDRIIGTYSLFDEDAGFYGRTTNLLCEIGINDGSVTPLEWYQPMAVKEGYDGNNYISLVRGDAAGNIWVSDTTESSRFNLPDNFNEETDDPYEYYEDGGTEKRVCCYAPDGTLLHTVALPEELTDAELVSIDEKGQLYYTDWENAQVLSSEGKIVKTIPLSSASLTDFGGKPAIENYSTGTSVTRLIDTDTFELGEEVKRPLNAWQIIPSNKDAYDYYYILGGTLYGYVIATQTAEIVVDWMDLDIDPTSIDLTVPLSDGRFLGVTSSYGYEEVEPSIIILTEVDPATIQPKTSLSLACMYLDYDLRSRIIDFNKTSDSVRILISDYSQYATDTDYYAGMTKLNTEIMAGKVPDLFVTNQLPIEQYISSGVIEPLNGYFEKDNDLSMDDLLPQIVKAASVDGKLYTAFPCFHIQTVVALKRVADNFDKWDLAAVQEAMKMLQDDATIFSVGYTRDEVLNQCVGRAINKFVDWESGNCSFDSQEFKDLLAFCAQFPTEFDWENFDWSKYGSTYDAIRNGQQLMLPQTVYSANDYMWTLAGIHEPIAFVGYPSQDGGGSSFQVDNAICVSAACAHKDAAWSFLRTFFTEEYQSKNVVEMTRGIPTNRAAFDEMIEKAMTVEYQTDENDQPVLDEEGQKIVVPKASFYIDDATQYEIDALSQEQADQLIALIDAAATMSSSNDAIFDIIQEETGAYFEGQRSIDDVANMIQNRVGLYVAEQK